MSAILCLKYFKFCHLTLLSKSTREERQSSVKRTVTQLRSIKHVDDEKYVPLFLIGLVLVAPFLRRDYYFLWQMQQILEQMKGKFQSRRPANIFMSRISLGNFHTFTNGNLWPDVAFCDNKALPSPSDLSKKSLFLIIWLESDFTLTLLKICYWQRRKSLYKNAIYSNVTTGWLLSDNCNKEWYYEECVWVYVCLRVCECMCVFSRRGSDVPYKVQLLKLRRVSAVCLHQSWSTSNGLI